MGIWIRHPVQSYKAQVCSLIDRWPALPCRAWQQSTCVRSHLSGLRPTLCLKGRAKPYAAVGVGSGRPQATTVALPGLSNRFPCCIFSLASTVPGEEYLRYFSSPALPGHLLGGQASYNGSSRICWDGWPLHHLPGQLCPHLDHQVLVEFQELQHSSSGWNCLGCPTLRRMQQGRAFAESILREATGDGLCSLVPATHVGELY